jgi:hypothetical protein
MSELRPGTATPGAMEKRMEMAMVEVSIDDELDDELDGELDELNASLQRAVWVSDLERSKAVACTARLSFSASGIVDPERRAKRIAPCHDPAGLATLCRGCRDYETLTRHLSEASLDASASPPVGRTATGAAIGSSISPPRSITEASRLLTRPRVRSADPITATTSRARRAK